MTTDEAKPKIDPIEFARSIGFIARMAERVAASAGVGGLETAGMIVSYLYANPNRIESFLRDGVGAMIDDPNFNHSHGGLTWHTAGTGEVISPIELQKRLNKGNIQ